MEEKHIKIGDKLGVDWKKISKEEFCEGMETESEHKDITKGSEEMTAKIVLAHLKEMPDYYSRLEKMEEKGYNKDTEEDDDDEEDKEEDKKIEVLKKKSK